MAFVRVALLAALLAVSVFSYLGPIVEGDLFWHLSRGRVLAEGGGAVPVGEFPTQWLGQLALYKTWALGGYAGIVYLRAGCYAAILLGMYLWMRARGVSFYLALFYLLFPARLFMEFPSERPQLFTFVLFPLTVFLIEQYSLGGKLRYAAAIPATFALWVNLHGGVILGLLALWVCTAGLAWEAARRKTGRRELFVLGGIALSPVIVFVLMEPRSVFSMAGAAMTFFTPSEYMKSLQEYLSPYAAARKMGQFYPAYWAFLALTAAALIMSFRRIPAAAFLLLGAFVILSLKSLRFMPFLVMLAPVVARYGPGSSQRWDERSKSLAAGFAAVIAVWVFASPISVRPGIGDDFPGGGMKFVRAFLQSRTIFNYQGWSGYLAWEVEGKRLFLSTEDVDPVLDDVYEKILWADGTPVMGKPQWRALTDAYGIDAVVIPGVSPVSGIGYPLVDVLALEKDWTLVYADDVTLVFVRDVPQNATAIGIYSVPKGNAYLAVVGQIKRRLATEPKNENLLRSLGDAYLKLGMTEEARKALAKVGVDLK